MAIQPGESPALTVHLASSVAAIASAPRADAQNGQPRFVTRDSGGFRAAPYRGRCLEIERVDRREPELEPPATR